MDLRFNKINPDGKCSVCHGPISKRNKIGICRGSVECRAEAKKAHDREFYRRHRAKRITRSAERVARQRVLLPPKPSPGPCNICGAPLHHSNTSGVDRRTPECREAYRKIKLAREAAWREAQGQSFREKAKRVTRAWVAAHPMQHATNAARQRAKNFGVPFDDQAVQSIWPPPVECPECGVSMVRSQTGVLQKNSPSVDRIMPSLGYVKGNVQWLCMGCNISKRDGLLDGKCELCGGPLRSASRYGVCTRNENCKRERARRKDKAKRIAAKKNG